MTQTIVIDPVTRIEGHAKISIYLDNDGSVRDAQFHVTEFRGFERFCIGRPFWEMPAITARICGICPISHILASAKAGDALLAVEIPPAADKLRRLMNLGQIIQSHALSFFHLSGPDLFLGYESDPAKRNIFGLIAAEPDFARGGIRLRQFGQEIIEALGGRKIHPAWAVPGGVRSGMSAEVRAAFRQRLPEAMDVTRNALARFKTVLDASDEEVTSYGFFPSLFAGMVTPEGNWEHHGGKLRVRDAEGQILADQVKADDYQQLFGEASEAWSYLKFPYYQPLGYPDGIYRVGPLARLNVCDQVGTPLADAELTEMRQRAGHRMVTASFYYHYARLIEILAALELVTQLLDDPELGSSVLRADAGVNHLEAVGCSEAPRGSLFHHYQVDKNGLITYLNLIIATGQNNLAMNQTVAQIARHYLRGDRLEEGLLNRVEAGIRAYDPCLSCSTHAVGQAAFAISLIGPDGRVVDHAVR
ncbi:Ni/Fe hydrogenase subunit alpha [Candidatus Chloroploca sp. M-50]|uniref:Ni/Fe hydrogenase subunit alpha n=1 Tax=Candidatus Chloroploca mongolica TaxID=2528176 RepID=A0ABS4D6Y6_9CHLR|nr:Ni/Fe hydrogenase subunit alpha [Candidatus Chloroploca mongolica]MBP1465202.1 Ni/Fe hydrogenase subunit alpha [Candidatus Chloroploca mongolica]